MILDIYTGYTHFMINNHGTCLEAVNSKLPSSCQEVEYCQEQEEEDQSYIQSTGTSADQTDIAFDKQLSVAAAVTEADTNEQGPEPYNT
jgi:hypothetical protein